MESARKRKERESAVYSVYRALSLSLLFFFEQPMALWYSCCSHCVLELQRKDQRVANYIHPKAKCRAYSCTVFTSTISTSITSVLLLWSDWYRLNACWESPLESPLESLLERPCSLLLLIEPNQEVLLNRRSMQRKHGIQKNTEEKRNAETQVNKSNWNWFKRILLQFCLGITIFTVWKGVIFSSFLAARTSSTAPLLKPPALSARLPSTFNLVWISLLVRFYRMVRNSRFIWVSLHRPLYMNHLYELLYMNR